LHNTPQYLEQGGQRKQLKLSNLSAFSDPHPPTAEPLPPHPLPLPEQPQPKKSKRNIFLGKKEAVRRFEQLIQVLLFDNKARKHIMQHQLTELEQERKRRWFTYVKHCQDNNLVIDLIQQMIFDSNMQVEAPLAYPVEPDLERVRYYSMVLSEIYDKTVKFMGAFKINADALGIAVLYAMQTGMSVNGIQVLPQDGYLSRNLPVLHLLPMFNYPKSYITKGTSILKDIYLTAVKNGASRADMMLSSMMETTTTSMGDGLVFMPSARDWKTKKKY
jgi:hypothetical protein